ncbi:MAG: DUF1707 domain-containing protein [Actinomycetota bacterium]|nr:DUF1707 domain-containing protein [Actinomycetota bacterium]
MSCQTYRRRAAEHRGGAVVLAGPARGAEPPGSDSRGADARVGDVDRQRTAEVLGDAAAGGYLRLDELDERLGQVWASTTHAELAAVAADLPPRAPEPRTPGAGAHVAAYLTVMLLLVTVWLGVGVAGGGWYPWPVWPALGWGACLARPVRAAARGSRSS